MWPQQRLHAAPSGDEGSERCKALGRYILEFCRHSLSALSERLEALRIVVAAGDLLQRHFTRRRIFARFEHGNVVAHTGSGLREHAAELTAAQKAKRGAGEKRFHFTHRSASGEFVDRERHGAGFCHSARHENRRDGSTVRDC